MVGPCKGVEDRNRTRNHEKECEFTCHAVLLFKVL